MRIENDVLGTLSAAQVDGAKLVLTGQLDRSLYTRTNKVLEAAGGKWDKKAKAHVFDGDAAERIEQIILTGSIVIPKDEFDFFETPRELATRIVEMAAIQDGMSVLEPSAGAGAIASLAGVNVDCIEIRQGAADMLRGKGYRSILCGDFLAQIPNGGYDRVLMNPPFSKRRDIKHVMHAFGFLKPGGILVAVMGAGVTFREDKLANEFRALLAASDGGIEELPEASFKASGTLVNAVLVTMHKR